jgi:outer membrane autotransporter protein
VLANGMVLTPHASAAWQHAFGTVTPTAALAFESNGAPFTVAGVPLAQDTALIEAGFDLHVNTRVTVGVLYFGEFAGRVQDNSVKGNLIWRF